MNIIPEYENVDCSRLPLKDQRALILHILYAVDADDYSTSYESVVDNISKGFDLIITPDSFVFQTAKEVIAKREQLDGAYKNMLDNWKFERIGVCTKLILRLAFWELLNTDTSVSIVINEAIELAKCFAEKDAFKFVNGILDEFVKSRQENQQS